MEFQRPLICIVATPIGNLEDISQRTIGVLKEADLIASEDTRMIRKILSYFNITKKEIVSYHDHIEEKRSEFLLNRVRNEKLCLALVSDAGTPCISDPGYRLVSKAHEYGIKVSPIPGASAVTALISASGLPSDRFCFLGFLPTKSKELKEEIKSWMAEGSRRGSIIFFESTRRLKTTLCLIAEAYPGAEVVIGRELTKLYEEIRKFAVEEAIDWVATHESLRGEVSIMVSLPASFAHDLRSEEKADLNRKQSLLRGDELEIFILAEAGKAFRKNVPLKELLKKYRDMPISRKELYNLLLRAKEDS